MKPPALGTVWTAQAKIKIIVDGKDEFSPNKWKTLATVMDTPNAKKAAVAKLLKKNPKLMLWMFDLDGKRPLF